MKILHIITGLEIGGAERMLEKLLTHSEKGDVAHSVITIIDSSSKIRERIEDLGVEVFSCGISRFSLSSLFKIRSIYKRIQSIKPDIIQGWMYHANILSSLITWILVIKTPVVWNIRHSLDDIKNEKLSTRAVILVSKILSPTPQAIIYNSNVSKIQHEGFGFSAKKSHIIQNGIDTNIFNIDSEKGNKIRTEFLIPGSAFVVGHIARYHPLKNHALFVKAAIASLNRCQDLHFILAGRDVTKYNSTLMNIIPENYQDQFHLIGERHDIYAILKALDIFCLSSSSEAWPNIVGEAMASGLPCVATDVGDTADIIGETGIVVPPKDPAALSAGLIQLIEMEPEQRKIMGRDARERIKEKYEIACVSTKYYNLYKNLMEHRE